MAFKGALLKPSERAGNGKAVAPRSRTSLIAKGSRYEILKDKIRTWCEDRFKVGEMLAELQRDKLYKAEYGTFEECCLTEFGLKHTHAYGLIAAVQVKASIPVSAIADKITNEAQARALAPVPVEKRVEVIEKVVERGPVTAKAITETARLIATPEPEEKIIHHDKTGFQIPDAIWDEWERAEAFTEHLQTLSRIKAIVSTGLDEGDAIFRELNNGVVAALKNLYRELKCVIPYAVCSSCNGRATTKCVLCKGRGFVSSFVWNQFAPAKIKEMRKAMAEKRK